MSIFSDDILIGTKGQISDDHLKHLELYIFNWLEHLKDYHAERPGLKPTDWHIEACIYLGEPFYIIYHGNRRYGTIARIKRDTLEYYRGNGKVPLGVIDKEYKFAVRHDIINIDEELVTQYYGVR